MESINPSLYGPRGQAYLAKVTSNVSNQQLETAKGANDIKQALGGPIPQDSYHASTHDAHSQQQMAWRALRNRAC
jgi:outer membrane protein assembly factor BamE (lipoprotein component of BamABCDE complex)